jgi:hypothetical protein
VHCLDDGRPGAARLHGLADFGQAPGQGRLADKRPWPAVRKEVVLGHNAVAVLEQVQEHLKHLRFEGDSLASTA